MRNDAQDSLFPVSDYKEINYSTLFLYNGDVSVRISVFPN